MRNLEDSGGADGNGEDVDGRMVQAKEGRNSERFLFFFGAEKTKYSAQLTLEIQKEFRAG